MFNRHEFIDFIQNEYHGNILTGNYSPVLKKKISDLIYHLRALDRMGSQSIPYISAWSDKNRSIWYEYASPRLTSILNCPPNQLSNTLNRKIIDQSIYKFSDVSSTITKEIFDSKSLEKERQRIRNEAKKQKAVEAVYKIGLNNHKHIWLKDQATVETHLNDGIFLSVGHLFEVTKEMQAESELKIAKEELKTHRDNLAELVTQGTTEIWRTQLQIVYRLAKAVAFRDQDSGTHITKMSHYCDILSKALGVKKSMRQLLFHATPMHDVGKIGISDRILLKPGKLSPEEFNVMKKHSNIGAKILSGHDSNLLKIAKSVALTHHEKWNGTGYPNGLEKKAIPLPGRIVAICDVFDALTSERPYKKAWSFDSSVYELHKNRGSHFDPELVDVFIKNLPSIKEVYWQKNPSPAFNA